MNIEASTAESREKPPVLYHASQKRDIERFELRGERVRDPNEGARIFATPDKRLATIFLVPTDDSWANSGFFGDTPHLIVSDENKFRAMDMGGAIYSLPSDRFETDLTKGLREKEWTSTEEVRPIGKKEYASGLTAMLESGVQVYFVDQETYEKTQDAPDGGYSILKTWQSENQRVGVGVVEF